MKSNIVEFLMGSFEEKDDR